jgi:glycosyltransferase involved in cell wall biosynthesis
VIGGPLNRRAALAAVIVGESLPDYGGSGANQMALALILAANGHRVAFASRWPVDRAGERVRSLEAAGVALLVPKFAGATGAFAPSEYALRRSFRLASAVVRNRAVGGVRDDAMVVEQRERDVHAILRRRVSRWLRRQRPAPPVIHVIGRETSPVMAPLRALGVPMLFTEFGQLLNFGLDAATVIPVRADGYSADSREGARVLERLEGREVRFITSLGGFPEPPTPTPELAANFVMTSRLDPVKQVHLAVEAVAQVPGIRLDIHGDGSARPRVEAAISDLEVSDRVTVHGMSDRNAVKAALDRAHGFLMTSMPSEGTPTAMLEAMSRARAIVTTAVGGIPDIVADGAQALFHDSSPSDLAAKLTRLATEPGLAQRLGETARRRWETEFTPEVIAGAYEDLYRDAVRSRATPPSTPGEPTRWRSGDLVPWNTARARISHDWTDGRG